MEMVLKKWGNSIGLHIPVTILRTAGLAEGDKIIMREDAGKITIEKANKKRHRTLEERVQAEYGMSVRDYVAKHGKLEEKEMDWGTPVGEEIW